MVLKAFDRLLVALSMTDPDAGLLRYAALVARTVNPKFIDFVHVSPPSAPQDPGAVLDRIREAVQRDFGQPAEGLELSYHLAEGAVLDRVGELAATRGADLILLGHRKGRTGRRSLASRLAMVAPCSVWMVPEGSQDRIGGILVPVDFSEHAGLAVEVAATIARSSGLEQVAALHAYFDTSSIRYEEHAAEVRHDEETAFSTFAAGLHLYGVQLDGKFEESAQPTKAILRNVQQLGSDLLVMGTRGRTPAAAILLGSVAAQTIIETPVPILVVKRSGAKMSVLDALLDRDTWSAETSKTN